MRMKVCELDIELAPLNRDVMGEYISPGMQQFGTNRYMLRRNAPVLEDEHEWFDRIRAQTDSLTWGIWDITDERKLIGTTGLHDIGGDHIRQATSGSMIFRQEYWGKGIATAIHKARTWYAFEQLGLHRLKSQALQPNVGSRKALERSGYCLVYTERNFLFVDGRLHHADNLECLNPTPAMWRLWWGSDRPTKRALEARTRTVGALDWAKQNVSLP
jgi:RimJ/RimL family protein N-acetyltransferase